MIHDWLVYRRYSYIKVIASFSIAFVFINPTTFSRIKSYVDSEKLKN